MVDVTASLDAATQEIQALLTQLRLGNMRFLQAQDIGAADAYLVAPMPGVAGYGPDLLLLVDVANPNATTAPKLTVQGLPQVPILAADGSPPAVGSVAGKRLIGFSTLAGGGFAAKLIGLAPADILPLLLPAIAGNTPGRLLAAKVFIASAAYVPNAAATVIEAEGIGGGGGGGGMGPGTSGFFGAAGGGGGGLQGAGRFTAAQVAAAATNGALPITIGAGGGATTGPGGNGGATSFGSLMSLGGGLGAPAGIAQSGGGYINTPGQGASVNAGCSLWSVRGADGGEGFSLSAALWSGVGGSGYRGSGGGVAVGTNTQGNSGQPPGSGGSGAAQNGSSSTAAQLGGSGAGGMLIIREYA